MRTETLILIGAMSLLVTGGCGGSYRVDADVQVVPRANTRFVQVAAGAGDMVCGRTETGRVACFNWDEQRHAGREHYLGYWWIPNIDDATDLDLGDDFGCATRASGGVWLLWPTPGADSNR